MDAQGPFPTSVRGNCYWFAVIDVATKLKLSYAAPTLKEDLKMLDHVLKRECNCVNRDVQAMFKVAGKPRKLDATAASAGPVAAVDLGEAREELNAHLS